MENIENYKDDSDSKKLAKQENYSKLYEIYKDIEKDNINLSIQKFKLHWLLIVLAIFITFLLGFLNEVTFFENLNRCFYAGSIFWLIAEIIDYILKN